MDVECTRWAPLVPYAAAADLLAIDLIYFCLRYTAGRQHPFSPKLGPLYPNLAGWLVRKRAVTSHPQAGE